MNDETRILIVEDLVSDYELARYEIRRSLENCKFERVDEKKAFLLAIRDFQPDLILTDYSLPGWDGMKVLKLAQKNSPSIPVIIWTGSVGESVAVECMKKGAANYVLKEDPAQLGTAVVQALEEKNRQFENKLTDER